MHDHARLLAATGLAIGIVAAPAAAHADAFAFSDADGFTRCLALDHLIETVKTANGEQSRILGPAEIQPRCVDAGVKLVTSTRNKDLGISLVGATQRLFSVRAALDLVGALTAISLPQCDDSVPYAVLMAPLDDVDDTAELQRARTYIKRCLKNPAFVKDFLDEPRNLDARHAARACQLLVDDKLVKGCKGAKP